MSMNPKEVQSELARLMKYAQTEKPSRAKLASELVRLASTLDKTAEVPVPRLERVIEAVVDEAKELQFSLAQYKKDDAKNAPALEKMSKSFTDIASSCRVGLRALGK